VQTPQAIENRSGLTAADIHIIVQIVHQVLDERMTNNNTIPIVNSTANIAREAPSASAEPASPSPPAPYAPVTPTLPSWKPKDVGLFHPWDDTINEAVIVTEGKHTIYKDVFAFTDRLKQLAIDDYDKA
jgi:hypothetical protein